MEDENDDYTTTLEAIRARIAQKNRTMRVQQRLPDDDGAAAAAAAAGDENESDEAETTIIVSDRLELVAAPRPWSTLPAATRTKAFRDFIECECFAGGEKKSKQDGDAASSLKEHLLQQLEQHARGASFEAQRLDWNGHYIQAIRGMKLVHTSGGGVHITLAPLKALGAGGGSGNDGERDDADDFFKNSGSSGGGSSSGGGGGSGESMNTIRSRLQMEKAQFFASSRH